MTTGASSPATLSALAPLILRDGTTAWMRPARAEDAGHHKSNIGGVALGLTSREACAGMLVRIYVKREA